MAVTAKDVQIVAAGLHDCCKMLDNMLWQHFSPNLSPEVEWRITECLLDCAFAYANHKQGTVAIQSCSV